MRSLASASSAILVLAAGCIEASSTLVVEGTPPSGPWATTIDAVPALEDGRVVLFALRATAATEVEWSAQAGLHYNFDGDVATAQVVWPGAPVDALKARSAGDQEPLPGRAPSLSLGVGGCGLAVPLQVTVGGEAVLDPEPACGGEWRGEAEGATVLGAGEWLLFGAGACGFAASDLAQGSAWTFDVRADAPLELEMLAAAPFACGIDFADHFDTYVLGMEQGDATFGIPSDYGATMVLLSGSVDGDWTTPAGDVAMRTREFEHSDAAGDYGFRVRSDTDAAWAIVGI